MRKTRKAITFLLTLALAGSLSLSAFAEVNTVPHFSASAGEAGDPTRSSEFAWVAADNAFKLDTLSYTMAPGNLYDFKVTLKGNLTQNDVKVTDSRNGSVVKLSRIKGTDKYRIQAVKEGTSYIVAQVGNAHLSFAVQVKKGVKQNGKASHSNYAVVSKASDKTVPNENKPSAGQTKSLTLKGTEDPTFSIVISDVISQKDYPNNEETVTVYSVPVGTRVTGYSQGKEIGLNYAIYPNIASISEGTDNMDQLDSSVTFTKDMIGQVFNFWYPTDSQTLTCIVVG
ncbi:hypothetical protein [Faecalispora anaeroviscerum]|uniref:hypothetical protein n=1 Tax=Faecalispora anaeroviscerum TaxID=2991836 RepID=UPI0024BA5406|nr:hypothetical protein [Faecalispora anaeroviscerum]